jgi:hypothetical protein
MEKGVGRDAIIVWTVWSVRPVIAMVMVLCVVVCVVLFVG